MKTFIAALALILVVSCNSNKNHQMDTLAVAADPTAIVTVELEPEVNPDVINSNPADHPHPYQAKFDVLQVGENLYDFVVAMELNNGAHFVSPNAKRDFKGKFSIQFDKNSELELVSELLETPRTEEEYDPHPFVRGTVNWVRENTKYNQRLQRTVNENFQVQGFIRFTIEPRCTLEKVPFIIKYEEGQMRVELFQC